MQQIGRFAPSPSGRMHLGNVFSALLAWLSVRSCGGTMILRIEDLDPARCRAEYADQLKRDLEWLGLDWDEEQTPQSARTACYAEQFARLSALGLVYPCYCTRNELHAASAPHASTAAAITENAANPRFFAVGVSMFSNLFFAFFPLSENDVESIGGFK